MTSHAHKAHEDKHDKQQEHDHKEDEHTELLELDNAEREGKVLTGAQRGRLADLRRADILKAVKAMLNPEKDEDDDKKDKKEKKS